MKVLAIGYYDDFARFFLGVKKEFKRETSTIEFRYHSLYFSGALYFWIRGHEASWCSMIIYIRGLLSREGYKKKLDSSKIYKGIDLEGVINYHIICNGTRYKPALLLQAIAAIDYWEKKLEHNKPDVLILSGDSRMVIEILNILAVRLGIKIYYFEQGPFGTTILDTEGVNTNATIRKKEIAVNAELNLAGLILQFLQRERSQKYKRSPIYRGSDFILQTLLSSVGFMPSDIFVAPNSTSKSIVYEDIRIEAETKSSEITFFLLILQVPVDVNMVYHSPDYSNHHDIVNGVYKALPANSKLVIREHPLFKGRYEDNLYNFIKAHNIPIDNETALNVQLQMADVVIVNNSTVGVEAIALYKPVVVLGNAYYDRPELCIKPHSNLSAALELSRNWRPDKQKVDEFLYYFFYNYLIDGHFRDENLKGSKMVANELMDEYYSR
ncbi:hypothetical protein ACH3O9_13145 [Leeuwenhoekiella sp. A16]|uniref:capsular polysaccharide export protein, LipB/KpsS family n=1 Tax=unclassified Leeuwenhoekiella TaxID=2615029 RepID=UPI003A812057